MRGVCSHRFSPSLDTLNTVPLGAKGGTMIHRNSTLIRSRLTISNIAFDSNNNGKHITDQARLICNTNRPSLLIKTRPGTKIPCSGDLDLTLQLSKPNRTSQHPYNFRFECKPIFWYHRNVKALQEESVSPMADVGFPPKMLLQGKVGA
jgi:hypothetical protein